MLVRVVLMVLMVLVVRAGRARSGIAGGRPRGRADRVRAPAYGPGTAR
ncbi:hypothetical protein Tamer19_03580 [Cupriavidus sp. TA19]|nr:hypothetical protein Tamer19_03580 [Cupriavidus sp. TA19]